MEVYFFMTNARWKYYDEELISHLSPYVTAHVNRFGKYRIDLNRKLLNLLFEMPVKRKKDIPNIIKE